MSHPADPQQPGTPPNGPEQAPAVAAAPPAPPAPPAPSYAARPPAPRSALPTTLAQTNTFALVAIILAFLQPIGAIVFGHMALSQIKRNGDAGRGIALTGLIVGYVSVAFFVVFILLYVSIIALAFSTLPFSDMGPSDLSY